MIERKTISIYAIEFEPTVAITYNVNKEDTVLHYQFWIREEYKYHYSLLQRIVDMISALESIPKENFIEKDIYRTYQETFDIEMLTQNYKITVKEFSTQKMVKTIKPYRNFIKTNKKSINTFIKNYIGKGATR